MKGNDSWWGLLCVFLALMTATGHGLGTERSLAQFGLETWKSDSGLPQNTVHAVTQTSDGFLWIGTEAGLVRFDGMTFRTFDGENTPQLPSDIINDLREDGTGALWISTTAGLVSERGGDFRLYTASAGLPSNAVASTYVTRAGMVLALTSGGPGILRGDRFEAIVSVGGEAIDQGTVGITESDQGEVWIASGRQLLRISADGRTARVVPLGAEVGELRSMAISRRGELWVGGRDGLAILGVSGTRRLTISDGLPANEVTALLTDGTDGMWVGTSRGLALVRDGQVRSAGAGEENDREAVTGLYVDREGTVWVATARGVVRLSGGPGDARPGRLRIAGVSCLFEDHEGSMWLGTEHAGLTALRERAFSTFSEEDGLSAGVVRALFQDRNETIWIGTDGGGLDRLERGKVSSLASHPALSSDVVLSVAGLGSDVWVGTPNGLDRVRAGAVRVFTTEDGLADDFVRSLYADRDGSLWVGTRNGLSHMVGERFTTYSRMDGLGSDLIGAILRTRGGDLWIGTLGGLSRWKGNGFENFTVRDGLGSDAVTSMLEDTQGTLWVGTQDGGLSRVRGGSLRALPASKTGLPETSFGILEDAAGDLWLSSRKGIARVSAAELNAFADRGSGKVTVRMYGVADGMRISECSSGGHPAAWRMRDGSLWFATLDGVALVAPELTMRNALPPPTVIEQVVVDDRPVERGPLRAGTMLTMPPGGGRISVQYAGLSFVAPQKVRYRYRLEGFDKEWIEAGSRREAFYTNLPAGRYRFVVLSANNDGIWSTTPATFDLRVQPTLLETRWFYVVLALGLGALAFAMYRWRVLSVEAQYRAVLGERGRIAREIHDTLAQGYVAISVQLEVTARLLESSKEAALAQLDQTKELVRGSLAEARSSIWNLRSQSEAGTLPSKLASLTESRSVAGGAGIKLAIQGTYRPVSDAVEREILRVAQEALTNALRHAGATRIGVTLAYDASTVRLLVSDDGRGLLDAEGDLSRAGHFGLQGMRERAARIGGTLRVHSRPGKGTTIELEVEPGRMKEEELL